MAKKRKPPMKAQSIIVSILLIIILTAGFFYYTGLDYAKPNLPAALENTAPVNSAPVPTATITSHPAGSNKDLFPREGQLSVVLIDVGQGDSIFIQSPAGKTMLIDAGEHEAYEAIDRYLSAANITTIDVLVATHPHADHIGGMAEVVQNYKIGAVYFPDVTHTSATFEKLATGIKNKGLKIKKAVGGNEAVIPFDEKLETRILAPQGEKYKDLNNYSVALRIAYGSRAFIFTGDAEALSEKEMLEKLPPSMLKADVLKIGHHGSTSSSSVMFLETVAPEIALISVGKDNSYNHPHEETIAKLNKAHAKVYRTDTSGIIAVFSDGKSLNIVTEK